MTYDPATVRAMLRQAYRRGHDDADEPAWNMHHKRCAEAGEAAINSILAAHPAPPTPAPSELHEHCVRMAMEAWDKVTEPHIRAVLADFVSDEEEVEDELDASRTVFVAAVRERLAQSAAIAACNLATNKDAAELLSAAEWLDESGGWARTHTGSGRTGVTWEAGIGGPRQSSGFADSTRLAILAAARSLGWPGGVK